jgi:tRNA 2-thiouridine synthesizing protein E
VKFNIDGRIVETNEQGFLRDLGDWSEEFAKVLAARDSVELYVDHWELIWYFRDYYKETQTIPSMRKIVLTLPIATNVSATGRPTKNISTVFSPPIQFAKFASSRAYRCPSRTPKE